MLVISMLTFDKKPIGGIRFELLSGDGGIVGAAVSTAEGKLVFDIDPRSLDAPRLRLGSESLDKGAQPDE